MASAEDLAKVREWAGKAVTDDDIDDRLDRLGNAEAVALEILRERRADIVSDPQSFSADGGDVAYNWGTHLEQLNRLIGQLEAIVPDAGGGAEIQVHELRREGVDRTWPTYPSGPYPPGAYHRR